MGVHNLEVVWPVQSICTFGFQKKTVLNTNEVACHSFRRGYIQDCINFVQGMNIT